MAGSRRIALRIRSTILRANPSTSLRANGSRECAPDDRLREAIQLVRSDHESWIASSQALLAMTFAAQGGLTQRVRARRGPMTGSGVIRTMGYDLLICPGPDACWLDRPAGKYAHRSRGLRE